MNWHGARCEFFLPHIGIRQGDMISPYLFVLCMEELSHLILDAVQQKKMESDQNGEERYVYIPLNVRE